MPLAAGDFVDSAAASPLGFHNLTLVHNQAPTTKILAAEVDKELYSRLKNVLVDHQNIEGGFMVLRDAEVRFV